MPFPEPRDPSRQWRTIGMAMVCAGAVLLAASFFMSGRSLGRSSWTDDRALQYQDAAKTLHGLSDKLTHAARPEDAERVREELARVQAEYDVLRGQLDGARRRPSLISGILRWAGLAIVVLGGFAYFAQSEP